MQNSWEPSESSFGLFWFAFHKRPKIKTNSPPNADESYLLPYKYLSRGIFKMRQYDLRGVLQMCVCARRSVGACAWGLCPGIKLHYNSKTHLAAFILFSSRLFFCLSCPLLFVRRVRFTLGAGPAPAPSVRHFCRSGNRENVYRHVEERPSDGYTAVKCLNKT